MILVNHNEFLSITNLDLKNKLVIDTCGLLYNKKYSESLKRTSVINTAAQKSTWNTL